ncbi:MAG TPA: organic solvent ABC transporter [Verrucomicrobiales bacterium]|nr:organic solvent ABC transporter [Verrucomicrobiales bacterium]
MISRILLTTLITCSFAAGLAASPEEAQQRLKTAVNEVLGVADRVANRATMAESLRPTLQKHISFETMTRRAVGLGWKTFTSAQQKQAVQLFTTLIIRSYSGKFTPGEHPVINYQKAQTPAAGRVDVPTSMVYKGSRYSVTYRMEQESGWRIADVVIEGVSLVANYRSQLDAQYKKGGAEAVLGSLSQSVSRPQ